MRFLRITLGLILAAAGLFAQGDRGTITGTIADSTGGATYFPDTIAQLGDMFDLIDRELRTQYRIAYYPDPRPPAGAATSYLSFEYLILYN